MNSFCDQLSRGNTSSISRKLNEGDGRRFRWKIDEDLENEIWKLLYISPNGGMSLNQDSGNEKTKKVYVSNFCRIHTNVSKKWYGTAQPNGYLKMRVYNKNFFIHDLVLRAFVGPPSDQNMTPNHMDKNPNNNCLENLEWMTSRERFRKILSTNK